MNFMASPDLANGTVSAPINNKKNGACIAKDTVIQGEISKCAHLEVYGYIEGISQADHIIVHADGKIIGTVKASSAEIHGIVQGDISVSGHLAIKSSGSVTGNVLYGQISMDQGAALSADVRNIPPTLSGDLDVTVKKGGSVVITTHDLTAIDPDDSADSLTFTVSKPVGGFVAHNAFPKAPASSFKQSDLETGKIMFVHNGSDSSTASFDVMVTDGGGAHSGKAQTVTIHVK